jgi:putative ABC transport system ATP-binding protein
MRLEGVKKHYRLGVATVEALRGIDLTVNSGDFVSVIGPSGSGKTTLLNIIGLLDRPSEGLMRLDGRDTSLLSDSDLSDLRLSRLGFVFQSFQLIPWLSARKNVEIPLTIAGRDRSEREERAVSALKAVSLEHRMNHRPFELSGGEQQRVALARALVNDPAVVLADEPTGNLDSKTGAEIISLMKSLNKDRGTTIIIVTHNLELAKASQVTYVLRDGLIVERVTN